ncbi:MAG: ACT domain-containing protein [Microthrixaceae bacterium]|nr:ACT domain-containing protein [Microthrixaceae bacterium]
MADADVNVDMIVQNVSVGGVTDISFTVPHAQLDAAMEICESERARMGAAGVGSDHDIAKVSVVGAGMKSNPGVAAMMFETLAANGINIEMISTSAIRISCVVAQGESDRAVQVLHEVYELEDTTF